MSVTIVKRPPRVPPPSVPSEEIALQPPPELPRANDRGGWLMNALPMTAGLGSLGFMFTGGSGNKAAMWAMGGLMLVSTLGYVVMSFVRQRQQRASSMVDVRRDYLRYLGQTRRHVRKVAKRQRNAQLYVHPDPGQLWAVVTAGDRLWERRPSDPDFVQVRVGVGDQMLSTTLVAPETAPLDELEPVSADALRRFLRVHGTLENLPMAISLRAFHRIMVVGEPERARGQVRSMLCQLATFHSPEDLQVVVVRHTRNTAHWDWVKWLPHNQHPKHADATGPVRLVRTTSEETEELLPDLPNRPRFTRDAQPLYDQPHLVIVVDEGHVAVDSLLNSYDGLLGVTVIELNPTNAEEVPRGALRLVVQDEQTYLEAASGASYSGAGDWLSASQAEALARQLAPLRLSSSDEDEPLTRALSFTDLMGLADAADVSPAKHWKRLGPYEKLKITIGVGESGEPVELDLKEPALQGMGPHGLCIGATGSGKSEVLRTLCIALAMTHSSEILNFVLTDFKGGATFAGMGSLPHVAATITNLADDLTMVDRMRDAIEGELLRRQEMLREAGNYKNIHDYERARETGVALTPMPSLLIVVDEFSELLTAKPDFIEMFIQIGRIGRSIGVHLLLASQRLEEGRLRGLETYLSYALGLRTFSPAESRIVLGVPDAYTLPAIPGSGYLKHGSSDDPMIRFKAAYVSGTYRQAGRGAAAVERRIDTARPIHFTTDYVEPAKKTEPETNKAESEDDAQQETVLDVIVSKLAGQGPPAHQVWLEPLKAPPTVDMLLGELQVTPERGLQAANWPLGQLKVALGIVDRPREQRRDLLGVDMSGAQGHAIVVGGTQSGKSTMLRTLIATMALSHTPAEVQFYCLDFGGGALSGVRDLAHVGGVATRMEGDLVRRMVSEVAGVIARREELFRDEQVDGMGTFRSRRAKGTLEDPHGDVFLVIDGWQNLKKDFELLEQSIVDIASRGLAYGVHVVISTLRWAEVRPALKDQMGTRMELRLGDPLESDVDRRIAQNVPASTPGRGLSRDKLHFLGGLPRIDGRQLLGDLEELPADGGLSLLAGELAEGVQHFVASVNEAWQGRPSAPRVRMLPQLLAYDRLPAPGQGTEPGVPIGVDENRLEPVYLNFAADSHFMVFGEGESGKTNFLRMLMRGVAERYTPEQAKMILVDYRRTLLGQASKDHLIYYAAAAPGTQAMVNDVDTLLKQRIPGPEVTQQQLLARSWWQGAELFVFIDDYDLVVTSSNNPLTPLLEYLPLARDVGFHLVLTRSSGGAGRALYEPVLQRLRELGAPGMLLSGNREEGNLLGEAKPMQLPPGRGILVSRKKGQQMVQTAFLAGPSMEDDPEA